MILCNMLLGLVARILEMILRTAGASSILGIKAIYRCDRVVLGDGYLERNSASQPPHPLRQCSDAFDKTDMTSPPWLGNLSAPSENRACCISSLSGIVQTLVIIPLGDGCTFQAFLQIHSRFCFSFHVIIV